MLKVVVVDDDKFVCECLRTMIDWDALEYEFVGEAYDGQQGYDLIKNNRVDVVITDLRMPGLDGIGLCKKIRETMENITIILLSAYEDFTAAQWAMRYQVKQYILKPLNEGKLNEINNILMEISKQYEDEQDCNYLLSENEFQDDIMNNLQAGNQAFFENLFDKLENMFEGKTPPLLHGVCLKMINVLYEFLKTLGFNEQIVEAKQATLNDWVREMSGPDQIVEFTKNMYQNILLLIPVDSEFFGHRLTTDIKAFVAQNYADQQMYYPRIAEVFNISEQQMRKIFKENTGMTLNEYINTTRLEKAAELLENSKLTIADIASMSGFSYSHYFARSFKNKFGISPNEYRNQALKNKKGKGFNSE